MDQHSVIEKFKVIKKKQFYTITPMVLVVILLVVLLENPKFALFGLSRTVLYVVAFGGIFLGLIFSLKNWRCPACNGYLRKNVNPKFCPKCGIKLQEN
ncbi:MAG: hypothetical protein WCT11_00035 [Candidatus Magasanikbacteria bacterium]